MDYPIQKIEQGLYLVSLAKSLYEKQAVFASAYKFTNRCVVNIEPTDENHVGVYLKSDKLSDKDLQNLAEEFCNEALDQQHRADLNRQFGHLRDLIVEHAFSPVNNLAERLKK